MSGDRSLNGDHTFTHRPESGSQAGLYKFINQLWASTMDHGGFSVSLENRKITLASLDEASGITRSIANTIENFLPQLSAAELEEIINYVAGLHQHPSVDSEE